MKDAAALGLLAAGLVLGGLREPELAAAGGAAAFLIAARRGPAVLGPAAWWLPWLIWAALSCLLSAQPWSGLPVLGRWAAFAAFLALASRWDAAERRRWLVLVCALGAALGAAALWTGRKSGWGHEMTGLLPPYYNYTAFVLAGAAAAAAAWALSPDAPRGRGRVALWTLAAALTACLVLARSRGGLMGLALAGAWLAWRRGGAKAALGLAAAAALAFVAAPARHREALLKLGRPFGEARPAIWAGAAKLASGRPWFGEGPGNFALASRRDPVEAAGGAARWGVWTPYAHSEPLHAAAETGLAGLALWLLAMGASWAWALRGGGRLDAAQTAARAALLAFLPQLLIDNMLQLTGLSFLLASALGAARARADEKGGPELPRAAALALAAFVMAGALPHAYSRPAPPDAELSDRLAALERAIRWYPADSELREDQAHLLEQAGEPAAAHEAWERARRLSPRNAVYPWRQGRLLAAAGRHERAAEAFARALELEPGFATARAERAASLAALGRLDEARAELAAARRAVAGGIVLSGYDRTVSRLDLAAAAKAEKALEVPPRRK